MQRNLPKFYGLTFSAFTSAIILFGLQSLDKEAVAQRKGPSPEIKAIIQSLSPEEREKFFSLDHSERRGFIMKRLPNRRNRGHEPANLGRGAQKGFRYLRLMMVEKRGI